MQNHQPAEPLPQPFPNLKGAILLMLGGWSLMLLTATAVSPFLGMQGTTAAGNIVGLSLMAWLGVRKARTSAKEVLSLRLFPARLLAPILILTFSGSILVAEFGNLTEEIFPIPQSLRDLLLRILRADTWTELLQRAALLVLMAPITEELMFRGVFLHGLVRNYGPTKGIVVTSICFGIFHLIPWQALGATLIGILLGIVVLRTGSVFAGMALHAMWNLLPLLTISVLKSVSLPGYELNENEITHIPVHTLILAAGIFLAALRTFWRRTAPPSVGMVPNAAGSMVECKEGENSGEM